VHLVHVETDTINPARHNPHLHERIVAELGNYQPGRILDIPAGPGYLLKDLQGTGFTGVAADIDTRLHCLEGVEYAAVDMSDSFPFPDDSFDFVVSIEGIEHIQNHFAFLAEVRRVLRSGGRLILTTPNIGTLTSRWKFFLSGFHSMERGPFPLDTPNIFFEHINPISFSQLYFACERSGLHVEKLFTSHCRRGSRWLYWLFFPLIRWSTRRSCFPKKATPVEHDDNRQLYQWLMSRENLTGGHTILTARAD
jgi:SAM-dependent methyltransferase